MTETLVVLSDLSVCESELVVFNTINGLDVGFKFAGLCRGVCMCCVGGVIEGWILKNS